MRLVRIGVSLAVIIFFAMSPAEESLAGGRQEPGKAQFIESVSGRMEALTQELRGKERNQVIFGANLVFAHGAFVKHFPTETLLKYADGLKEGGARRIELNPSIEPWMDKDRETIRKYDALVEHIRKAGLQLAINPEFVRIADKTTDFRSWVSSALRVYVDMAQRYRPDIFVVVHEPGVMAARMKQKVTPAQWAEFAGTAIRKVKRASPSTKCGVGVLFNERDYLERFLSLDGLDAVSVDIYSLADMKSYDAIITAAKDRQKKVYMEETWRPAYVDRESDPGERVETSASQGVGDYDFMGVDIKWLETLSLYAGVRGLEAITPFWTQTFFLYVGEGDDDGRGLVYNDRVVAAIEKGNRTDTFRTYKKLAETFTPENLGK